MTALGYHNCTGMAVKAVVSELHNKFSTRFKFLPTLPDFFYDFEQGLSPLLKQYLAKVPVTDRSYPWIALAYSYDSPVDSSVQQRNGFSFVRPITSILKRRIDFQYVDLPVVFSIVTNDSKLYNSLMSFLYTKVNYSFTCEFTDLLWPVWQPNTTYPLGWYIRPTVPNGKLYYCSTVGTTGKREPVWQTVVDQSQSDNTAAWKCIMPDTLKVRAGSFVKNNTVIQNPIDNGIMYQLDFGLTLHYPELDDSNEIIGIITEVELNLLYDGLKETLVAP